MSGATHRLFESLSTSAKWDSGGRAVFYLVVVYEIEDQVYVSMYWLVLSQLRLNSVQPVNEGLQGVCKLSGEQQGLLQLVLSAGEHDSSIRKASENIRSVAKWRETSLPLD